VPAIRSAAVIDVATAAEKLLVDDAVITSAEMLLGDVESLLDSVTMLQAGLLRRLSAARAVDATAELYGRSPKRWLIEDQLLAGPEAGRLIRLSIHLESHRLTETALEAGRITLAHASAILTALQTLPIPLRGTVEPHLVARALDFPPEEIGGFLDELLQRLGIDKDSDARRERRHNERGVDIDATLGGTRSLGGTLTPDVGEKVEAALADAGQKTGPDDDRTPRQRRHDALGVIADAYLGQQQPSFTGAPRTVIVTIDLDTLEQGLREKLGTLPSGATISPATARRLACDAEIIPVVLGGNSEVLDIGVADHEFTAAIRRAAYVRDEGTCAFPRCGNPVSELHHIRFRRHHGPTSLDNAAWLCAFHHWLVHEGGWTLHRADHGGYLFTNKHGEQFERFLHRHT
jgi:hypothetical protein